MPAPWSDFQPIVEHVFAITPEARRSDFLDICYANDVSDDVIDGFDSIDERILMKSIDDAKSQLEAAGALAG
jgi:predicted dienelactone hydrolase